MRINFRSVIGESWLSTHLAGRVSTDLLLRNLKIITARGTPKTNSRYEHVTLLLHSMVTMGITSDVSESSEMRCNFNITMETIAGLDSWEILMGIRRGGGAANMCATRTRSGKWRLHSPYRSSPA